MFYNTGTAGTRRGYELTVRSAAFSTFRAFCGANCQISAPTTGTYAGILFFNDRNNTATSLVRGFGVWE